MKDQLRQPLERQTLMTKLRKRKPSTLQVAWSALATGLVGLAVWLAVAEAPRSDEPLVAVKIHPLEKITTATTPASDKPPAVTNDPPPPDPDDVAADHKMARQEVAIIRRPGHIAAKPLRRAPVKAVSERGPFGVLPKIARNGRRPFDVYSASSKSALARSTKPKIVLVIGGMGLNHKLTERALGELSGHVTFAFAPYGKGLQRYVNRARRSGHEIILHLPMEPQGYPAVNPGPKTLLAAAEPQENIKNLKWLMSRFAGYGAVTNYMGARFTSDGGAMLPVLSTLKSRGLVYFDDGSNSGKLTADIAGAVNLPIVRADIVIDENDNAQAIEKALQRLEALANSNGLAIGFGTGLGTTIEAVEEWSRGLSDRGILLVPLSMAYRNRRS